MTIYIVDLEGVETRYTGQWKQHVPKLLKKEGHDVVVIDGPTNIPAATSPGAFLNFGGTNIYKAAQVEKMGRMFCANQIRSGDHFLFTDAWHPGIINLKYMSELLSVPITIHALWHAGSYDPQDFLGRLIGDAPWVRHAEQSFFHAIDHNYFATESHIQMFAEAHAPKEYMWEWVDDQTDSGKIVRTGWPMEYMAETLEPYRTFKKKDLIIFPHRLAPEKQVEIFKDLALQLPQYEWVVCQEKQLTKHEYHSMMARAKIIFSANLQETLGITTCSEGPLLEVIPMAPDRLSYTEIFKGFDDFLYPSKWTESWEAYLKHRDLLVGLIQRTIENFDLLVPRVNEFVDTRYEDYFHAKELIKQFEQ